MASATLRELRSFGDGKAPIVAIALSPDGEVLATSHATYPGSSESHRIRLWQIQDGRELASSTPDMGAGGPVAFSPDGTLLATGSTFGVSAARIWETAPLSLVTTISQSDSVKSVAFSADNKWLAIAAGRARVFAAGSWQQAHEFEGLKDYVTCLAFTPDSSALATATYSRDRRVVLWKTATWEQLREFAGHEEGAMRVAFSPDGRKLAAGSNYKELKLWDVATGRQSWATKAHPGGIIALAFSPDGYRLASASNEAISLCWVNGGALMCSQPAHTQYTWGLAFAPDGKTLISGGYDGRVRIWELPA